MRKFLWFVFIGIALSMQSCQLEEDSVTQTTNSSFDKSSPISSLIMRVSQYETTKDNILDGTSNCSIKLPVMVQINNQYVYVFDANGYDNVQAIKNESTSDDDIVHFVFPISIVYPNYSEYKVSSQDQLDYIFSHYGDDSSYHEIKCIDFNFPFTINKYNTDSQVSSSINIASNMQFYNFVNDLEATEVVGFAFPIMLTKSGGQQIAINNNTELENAIDVAVNSCNAAPSPMTLTQIMSSGTWHVSYCYYDYDETAYYSGYNFTYNTNGTCTAVKTGNTIMGDWSIHNDGSFQRIDLNFDGSQLSKLEAGWKVQEYTSTYVRLKRDSSGGGSSPYYYLYLSKN